MRQRTGKVKRAKSANRVKNEIGVDQKKEMGSVESKKIEIGGKHIEEVLKRGSCLLSPCNNYLPAPC